MKYFSAFFIVFFTFPSRSGKLVLYLFTKYMFIRLRKEKGIKVGSRIKSLNFIVVFLSFPSPIRSSIPKCIFVKLWAIYHRHED